MVDNPPQEIVVIDDDLAVLDSFRFMLELAGFPVATYPSAIDYLKADRALPRCLILDQNMPQMTGLELISRLRTDGVEVPTILITSARSPAIDARAAEVGVDRVFDKPPSEDELIRFVASCGEQST
jgi:FixJ family two-component response regulator